MRTKSVALTAGMVSYLLCIPKQIFMKEDTNKPQQQGNGGQQQNEEPLKVHNPFNANDDKVITQNDIDNEQKIKEAMTERD